MPASDSTGAGTGADALPSPPVSTGALTSLPVSTSASVASDSTGASVSSKSTGASDVVLDQLKWLGFCINPTPRDCLFWFLRKFILLALPDATSATRAIAENILKRTDICVSLGKIRVLSLSIFLL